MSPMTIGSLSRRTGVSVKALREYEDMGLIYTVGRSPGNYRLFDDDALWCVNMVAAMRGLGLTLAEIQELTESYLGRAGEPMGPRFAVILTAARRRITERIAELRATLERIDAFEARPTLTPWPARAISISATPALKATLDSPPGGRQ